MGGQFAPEAVETTTLHPRQRWRKVQEKKGCLKYSFHCCFRCISASLLQRENRRRRVSAVNHIKEIFTEHALTQCYFRVGGPLVKNPAFLANSRFCRSIDSIIDREKVFRGLLESFSSCEKRYQLVGYRYFCLFHRWSFDCDYRFVTAGLKITVALLSVPQLCFLVKFFYSNIRYIHHMCYKYYYVRTNLFGEGLSTLI